MRLADVMSRDVEVISPEATVQEAAQRMRARRIGSVLVGDGERFDGILTEHDIAERLAAEGRHPTTTRVREVMTPEVLWCDEDAEVAAAIAFMNARGIRHLAVLDRRGRLVGIASLRDLALHAGDPTLAGTAIRWPA